MHCWGWSTLWSGLWLAICDAIWQNWFAIRVLALLRPILSMNRFNYFPASIYHLDLPSCLTHTHITQSFVQHHLMYLAASVKLGTALGHRHAVFVLPFLIFSACGCCRFWASSSWLPTSSVVSFVWKHATKTRHGRMSDALSELTGTLRRRTTKDDLRWGSKVTWGYQPRKREDLQILWQDQMALQLLGC
jgi:hypothetical protein